MSAGSGRDARSADIVDRHLESVERRIAEMESVPIAFRNGVHALADRMAAIAQDVARLEQAIAGETMDDRPVSTAAAIRSFGRLLHEDVRRANLALSTLVDPEDPPTLRIALDFYRCRVGPYVDRSPFAARSFHKPLGYAGDYEMMGLIYRNADEGDSLFARCMERAMQLHPEPQAVRNRVGYLCRSIAEVASGKAAGQIGLLSMACGPARELEVLVESGSLPKGTSLTAYLVDQDARALEHARGAIQRAATRSGARVVVRTDQCSIVDVIRRRLTIPPVDLVYSAGLFDYLGDGLVKRAGDALARMVAPGGRLVIGNFSADTPNAFGMLSMFDWPLVLRTAAQLSALLDRPGFESRVEAEELGINLFHVAQRPSDGR